MHTVKWKSSKNPGKQVKYRATAPLHIKGKFMRTHLSDDLSKKYQKRSARVVKGDKVSIIKGQFKGRSGKVERVDIKNSKVFVEGIDRQKGDGTKIKFPIAATNVMITELATEDKKRQEILKRK